MAYLTLKSINKIYPNGFHAVHNFSLEIEKGEFVVFVGPSGCGKSTTLRMIAGLEDITGGTLKINDRVVNDVEPKDCRPGGHFQRRIPHQRQTGQRVGPPGKGSGHGVPELRPVSPNDGVRQYRLRPDPPGRG